MASVHASSPVEQPALHSRSRAVARRAATSAGSTRSASTSNWPPIRKKYVSEIVSASTNARRTGSSAGAARSRRTSAASSGGSAPGPSDVSIGPAPRLSDDPPRPSDDPPPAGPAATARAAFTARARSAARPGPRSAPRMSAATRANRSVAVSATPVGPEGGLVEDHDHLVADPHGTPDQRRRRGGRHGVAGRGDAGDLVDDDADQ